MDHVWVAQRALAWVAQRALAWVVRGRWLGWQRALAGWRWWVREAATASPGGEVGFLPASQPRYRPQEVRVPFERIGELGSAHAGYEMSA